jgi:hypothetical protein
MGNTHTQKSAQRLQPEAMNWGTEIIQNIDLKKSRTRERYEDGCLENTNVL